MDRQYAHPHQPGIGQYTRRRLLAGGMGAAGIAGLAFVACGSEDKKTTSSTAGSPAAGGTAAAVQIRRGGTYVVAGAAAPTEILDPHRGSGGSHTFWAYIANEALRISPDGKQLEPTLVEKYEIPGDGTEIILHARQGVKWHNRAPTNGRAFVGDDVAYNVERITGRYDPSRVATYQRRSTLPNLESAKAVDATTVQVKLSAPHSGFLRGLAHERNYFIPKELVDAQQDKWNDPMTLVGTGAWMYESFQKDVKAVLKPNPDYWEPGKPYLDSIEEVALPDRLSTLAAFSQGKIDLFTSANKTERDTLSKTYKDAQLITWTFANWDHFRFNVTRRPFTDARVRQAFQLVFNYKQWADAYYGDGFWDYTGPLAAAFPEAIPSADVAKLSGWNPATKDQDIKTAKDLMTAAGYPDGNISFKIMVVEGGNLAFPWKDFAIQAQDNLKRVWPAMDVTLDVVPDIGSHATRSVQANFDMLVFVIYSAPDAVLELVDSYRSDGSRNYGKFKDSQIDELLDKGGTQLDTSARAATLREVQDLLLKKHVYIITVDQPKQVVHVSPRVRGLEGAGRPFGGSTRDITLASRNIWLDKG